jgi:hypothetical protein
MSPDGIFAQALVWIACIASTLIAGVLSMGLFFGFASPVTWLITLGDFSLVFAMIYESNESVADSDLVAVL